MKYTYITILFVVFNISLNAQIFDEAALKSLSDMMLQDNQLMTYDTYKTSESVLKSGTVFTHAKVFELNKNSYNNTDIDKILIIVNSDIYTQLKAKIERYALDIYYVYGCHVIIENVNGGNHTDIRGLIKNEETNLNGVVLIGNISVAWYELAKDYDTGEHAEWPCDLYYMDTDGIWGDLDNDGIYDSHTGNVSPEIFIGRISTANMGTLIPEIVRLENYLDKNHKFWMGQLTVNKKFGLSYIDKDWAKLTIPIFEENYDLIQYLYGSSNYDPITFLNFSSFGKTDYLNRLSNNRYEYIHLFTHSTYKKHVLNGDEINCNEILNTQTEAIGYNLFCCSACRWTSVSSTSTTGFIAGAYIYNTNNSGLVVIGSTKVGSMLNSEIFFKKLSDNKCYGQAHLDWWIDVMGTSHSNYMKSWHYGLTIIGDPLINMFHCMNDKCSIEDLSLTTFDNTNTLSVQYFLSNKIKTANNINYIIPSGKNVVLNAKSIELYPGFKCQVGGTVMFLSDGCNANCP